MTIISITQASTRMALELFLWMDQIYLPSHSILVSMASNDTASDGHVSTTNLVDGGSGGGAQNSPAIYQGYEDGWK